MAVLTQAQLNEVLQAAKRVARQNTADVTWTKQHIYDATQALEDYVETTKQNTTVRVGAGTAIEAAAPGVFGATAKTWLFFLYMRAKAGWEGIP